MEREFLIYVTTNKINNKIYVGQTHYRRDDYFGSGVVLKIAIEKYGKKNFKKTYIDKAESQKDLDKKEKFWIKELKAQDNEIGYNIADGGWNDFTMNEEIKKKISKTLKGKYIGTNAFRHGLKLSKEHIEKIRKSNKGRKKSEKQIEFLRNLNKGRILTKSKLTREKMSKSRKGKTLTDDHKRKISESGKARNFKWSDEQIKKIKDANLNKHQKRSWYVDLEDKKNLKIIKMNNIMQASRFLNISKHKIKVNFENEEYKIIKIYK